MEKVFIFGHRRPDTDSVTAAITLSYLKNQLGMDTVPVVLSEINHETKFVLDYFGVKEPKYLNDVKAKVRDLKYSKGYFINDKTSAYQGFLEMTKAGIHKIPVVDDKQQLVGILSMKDIANDQLSDDLHHFKASYDNILEVLHGTSVNRFDDEIEGETLVASYKSTTFIETVKLDSSKILIMGDRHSIIEYAVSQGVKLIILTGISDIKPEHLEIAKQNKVNIIKTDYDTFKVTRILNLCKYASDILSVTDVLCIKDSEDVTEFVSIANKTKYSYYPVIDQKDQCLGIVRLSDAHDISRYKVILVDHNTYEQSAIGLDEAEIIEIVDHHNIGSVGTEMPINFRNMPVGSTNTVIYQMYQENLIPIPKSMAGLMLSGILSDTMVLKSPTTTDIDRKVVKDLCNITNLNYEEYGESMLKAGLSIAGKTIEEVLYTDFKTYPLGDHKMSIAQIFVGDVNEVLDQKSEYQKLLNQISLENDYLFTILIVTDVIRNGSHMLFSDGAKNIIKEAFHLSDAELGVYIPDILSRKKQVVPKIIMQCDNI